ncbi:hypothetical protein AB205_0058240 [Aquarana catesbeiana]|uniref:Uncharacterized protein n=1 Tax=Aquarana catesbeiana TaxID=8400 RepID=A0A2G9QHV8_AQUCT|nr:hypothetical protein AB205_0058240 [Aquarana catesbeiana]
MDCDRYSGTQMNCDRYSGTQMGCDRYSGTQMACDRYSDELRQVLRWAVTGTQIYCDRYSGTQMGCDRYSGMRYEYHLVVLRSGGPRRCGVWVGPEACLGPTTAAEEWSWAVCPE